ncbi:MAG: DUF3798 domain-containing protein [Oscillospiraceae bacterium]|jgi:hypothetical protein|nr:DUF3798 domain-containing protein [Oscillospiraceae bacterium]
MKNGLRRVALLCLTLATVTGTLAGCKRKEPVKLEAKGRIVVFAPEEASLRTEIDAARVLRSRFVDQSMLPLQHMTVAQMNSLRDYSAKAMEVMNGQKDKGTALQAAVFAPGFSGAAAAAVQVKRDFSGLPVAVCQPQGLAASYSMSAALVLQYDDVAMAEAVTSASARLGAQALYYLTSTRTVGYESTKVFLQTLQTACKANGIQLHLQEVHDVLQDGKETAQADITQVAARALEQYGEGNFAVYASDRFASEIVAVEVLKRHGILPGVGGGTPFEGIPAALSVDMKGHEADAAYALEQCKLLGESQGLNGNYALWQASLPALLLETAVRCVNNLEKGTVAAPEQVEAAFVAAKEALGVEATLTRDETQANLYRVSCALQ